MILKGWRKGEKKKKEDNYKERPENEEKNQERVVTKGKRRE